MRTGRLPVHDGCVSAIMGPRRVPQTCVHVGGPRREKEEGLETSMLTAVSPGSVSGVHVPRFMNACKRPKVPGSVTFIKSRVHMRARG